MKKYLSIFFIINIFMLSFGYALANSGIEGNQGGAGDAPGQAQAGQWKYNGEGTLYQLNYKDANGKDVPVTIYLDNKANEPKSGGMQGYGTNPEYAGSYNNLVPGRNYRNRKRKYNRRIKSKRRI